MVRKLPRVRPTAPLIVVAAAGIVVGCGGGGASGASPKTSGGNSQIATTGGVADPITGGATTGTDPTGGGTTGGAVGGGTTGGDATGGEATGGTPGPAGLLRPNAIYFGHYDDASVVSSILPDGTARIDRGGSGPNVLAAIPDPLRADGFVYVASVDGLCGVYRGTSFDPAASETLAAPIYDYVATLQASADGAVLFVAGTGGTSDALLFANGATHRIDAADGAAISLDGAVVAYTKVVNGFDELHRWTRATGESQTLVATADAILPSFSKDGAWILFSSNRDATSDSPFDLYQVPSSGGAVQRITDTPAVNELGACYNADRTRIAYVAVGDDPSLTGLYVRSNASAVRIAADLDLGMATYWTDPAGRAPRRFPGARFQSLRRLR